jgi:CRISPR-associated protein Cst2
MIHELRTEKFYSLEEVEGKGQKSKGSKPQADKTTLVSKPTYGPIYEIVGAEKIRRDRTSELLKALVRLRGGAKQAAFATDVSPKAIIMAGLSCGNPVFNNLFKDNQNQLVLKTDVLKEIALDYKDRIHTPIYIGIRKGYLSNEDELKTLNNCKENGITYEITTPIDAAEKMTNNL